MILLDYCLSRRISQLCVTSFSIYLLLAVYPIQEHLIARILSYVASVHLSSGYGYFVMYLWLSDREDYYTARGVDHNKADIHL